MARAGGGRSGGRSGGRTSTARSARGRSARGRSTRGRKSTARSARGRKTRGRSARGRSANRSTSRGSRRSRSARMTPSRRGTSLRRSRGPRVAFRPQNFNSKIKMMKNKISPKYKIQTKTMSLLSSFLNDIIQNVTLKAKENTASYKKKTITYMDVMVAAMNTFGDQNKWIDRIMNRGLKKSKVYEDKIGYTLPREGEDPADDLPDVEVNEEGNQEQANQNDENQDNENDDE